MRWMTRRGAKVDRIACPWLIRRYVDPDQEKIRLELPLYDASDVLCRERAWAGATR